MDLISLPDFLCINWHLHGPSGWATRRQYSGVLGAAIPPSYLDVETCCCAPEVLEEAIQYQYPPRLTCVEDPITP